jgi:hypothetical protein
LLAIRGALHAALEPAIAPEASSACDTAIASWPLNGRLPGRVAVSDALYSRELFATRGVNFKPEHRDRRTALGHQG